MPLKSKNLFRMKTRHTG